MAPVITVKGIDQAISELNYQNKTTLKYRLINVIRGFYENENSIESLKGIDPDKLIRSLWDKATSPSIIKNRRKNLSSIRSSVNADLEKLYGEGENPEGVTLGASYIFVMSDEAKDKALKAFIAGGKTGGPVNLGEITRALDLVDRMLSKPEAFSDIDDSEGSRKLDKLRDLIHGLSEKVGADGSGPSEPDPASSAEASGGGPSYYAGTPDTGLSEGAAEKRGICSGGLEETGQTAGPVEADMAEEPEDTKTDEPLESCDLEEELDLIDADEDLEEADDEEILEEVEEDEEPEVVEINELPGHELIEDIEGISAEDRHEGGDEIRKARLLAEEFNDSLAAMDKFYNQHKLIPGGNYYIGNKQPRKDERGELTVPLSPFYMSKFPVTNTLFEVFIDKTGYRTTAEKLGYGTVYYGRCRNTVDERTGMEKSVWNSSLINKTVEGACWYQPLGPGSTLNNKRKHPVVQISIEDAMAFAAWTGKRLPTEDEWEASARTGSGYSFPWGNSWRHNGCNTEESYVGDTTPVDRYIEFENDFGIVDTLGNVLEWTKDISGPPSPVKTGPTYYIAKGGSWISKDNPCLSGRVKLEPESCSNILGFRCIVY